MDYINAYKGEPGGVAVKTSEFVIQGRGFESDDRHYYISLSYLGGVREGHPATKSPASASADPSYLHRGIPVAPGPARPHRGSSTLKWNFIGKNRDVHAEMDGLSEQK